MDHQKKVRLSLNCLFCKWPYSQVPVVDYTVLTKIGIEAIDVWLVKSYSDVSDTVACINDTITALGLNPTASKTCQEIFLKEKQLTLKPFYTLSKMLLNMNIFPWTSLIQAFIFDLMTNRQKYPVCETCFIVFETLMPKSLYFSRVPSPVMNGKLLQVLSMNSQLSMGYLEQFSLTWPT